MLLQWLYQLLIISLLLAITEAYPLVFFHAGSFEGDFKEQLSKKGLFVGGLPRLQYYLNEHRNHEPLIVNGNFIRMPYSTRPNRILVERQLLQQLRPTVMTFGKNELNLEIMNYQRILEKINFPIISTNMKLPHTVQYHTIEQSDIVILSYTPEEYKELPLVMTSGTFVVKDMIETLNDQIQTIIKGNRTRKFVFIASGCAGFSDAEKIAKHVRKLDIVISGCSRTMQWNSNVPPDNVTKHSAYPLVMYNDAGKKVLIAHTYGTRFLGKLELEINSKGDVQSHRGTMIYLSHDIPNDEHILETVKQLDGIEIAMSRVMLKGRCSRWECNLGDLITDALVQYRSNTYKGKTYWTDTPIGLMADRNIKADISASAHDNVIIVEDLLQVIHPHHQLVSIQVKGETLRKTVIQYLEKSTVQNGIFLQVSGLHIRYDRNKISKRRLVALMARCYMCKIPQYFNVNNNRNYNIITTIDVYQGEIGHTHLANNSKLLRQENTTDFLVVQQYLMQMRYIRIGSHERIRIVRKKSSARTLWAKKSLLVAMSFSIASNVMTKYIHKF